MPSRFAESQLWLLAAVQGGLFAASMTAYGVVFDHDGVGHSMRGSLVGGVFFAVFMWFTQRREGARTRRVLGAVPPEQQHDVMRAATTGTPPQSTELRPAAAALARHRLAEHMRLRTFTIVVIGAFAMFAVVGAMVDSVWYLLGAAFFTGALVWTIRYPQGLRRRIAALEGHAQA